MSNRNSISPPEIKAAQNKYAAQRETLHELERTKKQLTHKLTALVAEDTLDKEARASAHDKALKPTVRLLLPAIRLQKPKQTQLCNQSLASRTEAVASIWLELLPSLNLNRKWLRSTNDLNSAAKHWRAHTKSC